MDTNPIDLGSIEVLQVLDEQGNVNASRDPKLSDEELLAVHRAMVLTRAFDARMLTMQRQGEMGTLAPNLGQEACMIGQAFQIEEKKAQFQAKKARRLARKAEKAGAAS